MTDAERALLLMTARSMRGLIQGLGKVTGAKDDETYKATVKNVQDCIEAVEKEQI